MIARLVSENRYLSLFVVVFLLLFPFERAIAFPEADKAELVADKIYAITEKNFDRIDQLAGIYPKTQDPQSMEAVCIFSINNGMSEAMGFILNTVSSIQLRNMITEKAYIPIADRIMKDQVKIADTSMTRAGQTLNMSENVCANIDGFDKIHPIVKSMMDDLYEIKSVLLKQLN